MCHRLPLLEGFANVIMYNWGSDSRRLKVIISFSKDKIITFLFEICSRFKLDVVGQTPDTGGLTLRMMTYISTQMISKDV